MSAKTPARQVALDLPGSPDPSAAPLAERLQRLLAATSDLSSSSDEVAALGTGWLDRYHLSTERANPLRALPLTQSGHATVLELGAGAGAVTRYLGETFASVDAVEPDSGLAAVATQRCADLTSVTVRRGWTETIDDDAVFDVVVALDVMGELRRRDEHVSELIAWVRPRLAPGGVLVISADNARGVRFVAGEATPRLRDDPESRPPRIDRDELEQAVRDAGLSPTVLSAFPDHRRARVLFDHDALGALDPQLLAALPSFPSPAYDGAPATPRESILWREALEAGEARGSSNGLVVVASQGGLQLDAVATYWSQGRRAALSATNTIVPAPDGAVVHRARTFPAATAGAGGPLDLRPHSEPLLRGTPLSRVLAGLADLDAAVELLRAWSDLVESSVVDGAPVPWDLIPRNVMVLESGDLATFDQEWELEPTPGAADLVRARGAFWLAVDLLFGPATPPWLQGATVGSAADFILRLTRPSVPADWFETFVDQESTLVSHIWLPTHGGSRTSTARRERKNMTSLSNTPAPRENGSEPGADLREVVESLSVANADLRAENAALRVELRHTALIHRDDTMGLIAASEALKDRLQRAHAQNRRHKAQVTTLQNRLSATKASRTWRVGSALVRPFAAIARAIRR